GCCYCCSPGWEGFGEHALQFISPSAVVLDHFIMRFCHALLLLIPQQRFCWPRQRHWQCLSAPKSAIAPAWITALFLRIFVISFSPCLLQCIDAVLKSASLLHRKVRFENLHHTASANHAWQ